MRLGMHRISRDPHLDTTLRCRECKSEREEKKALLYIGKALQQVWFLGCKCPAPAGVMPL